MRLHIHSQTSTVDRPPSLRVNFTVPCDFDIYKWYKINSCIAVYKQLVSNQIVPNNLRIMLNCYKQLKQGMIRVMQPLADAFLIYFTLEIVLIFPVTHILVSQKIYLESCKGDHQNSSDIYVLVATDDVFWSDDEAFVTPFPHSDQHEMPLNSGC